MVEVESGRSHAARERTSVRTMGDAPSGPADREECTRQTLMWAIGRQRWRKLALRRPLTR